MNAGRDFETKIVVKVNAPEVLRRQLAAPRWKGEHVAMGTATDPYQRAEGRYRLMPRDHPRADRPPEPLLDPHEGHPDPARPRPAARGVHDGSGLRGVLHRHARRGRVAPDRAGDASPARADGGGRGAEPGGHPDRGADGADPAGDHGRARAAARGRRGRDRGGRHLTSRRSCCTCAPACARSSFPGSPSTTPTSSIATSRCTGAPTPRPRTGAGSAGRSPRSGARSVERAAMHRIGGRAPAEDPARDPGPRPRQLRLTDRSS